MVYNQSNGALEEEVGSFLEGPIDQMDESRRQNHSR